LNQYTNRTVPAYVDIMGLALATNPVTVNGTTASRKGEYFREQVAVGNGSSAVWEGVTNSAAGQAAVTGHLFVPQTPENFTYDADGNLIKDGRWTYGWDAENRLTNMTSLSTAPAGSQLQLNFVYDYKGRRIQKTVSTNSGLAYVVQSKNAFLYDGWNLIAELNVLSTPTLVRSYVWGLDLSGTPQGAGGVGGLLKMTYYGTSTTNCFPAFDGNGDVSALINATNASLAAQYEYSPFGELLRATGLIAKANPLRFSTKYQDDETDLLYYGYRFCSPSTGRWVSRDALDGIGASGLYVCADNCPTTRIDIRGAMTLREFPQQLPYSPTSGPYTNASGLTWFRFFEPEAKTYKSIETPCCWKIFLPGHADLYYWWVDPEDKVHELEHVAVHRATYHGFKDAASIFVGPCFSECTADCLRDVINDSMREAWLALNRVENLEIDCNEYGGRCDEIPGAIDKMQLAWAALARDLEKCAQ